MPRPKRCRRVCSEPEYSCFEPEGVTNPESVVLSVDHDRIIRSMCECQICISGLLIYN